MVLVFYMTIAATKVGTADSVGRGPVWQAPRLYSQSPPCLQRELRIHCHFKDQIVDDMNSQMYPHTFNANNDASTWLLQLYTTVLYVSDSVAVVSTHYDPPEVSKLPVSEAVPSDSPPLFSKMMQGPWALFLLSI